MEKKVKMLVYLIDEKNKKILLGLKKVRFGTGKWNGYGGKVAPGETIESAAIRELEEESGIKGDVADLVKLGVNNFHYPHLKEINEVHIFRLSKWNGEPVESEEMKPRWFSFDDLPYDTMWSSDRPWVPLLLNSEAFHGEFLFDDAFNVTEYKLNKTDRKEG